MAGKPSKTPRAKATIQEFKDQYLGKILEKLPKEALAAGKFKVYQRRPGPNGGMLTSYLDWMEFDPDGDLESEVAARFIPKYGGGEYVLHLYDAFRNRIPDLPDILLNFPGPPAIVAADMAGAGGTGTPTESLSIQLHQANQQSKLLTIQQQNAFAEAQIAKLTKGGEEKDPLKLAMADIIRSKIVSDDQPKPTSLEDLIKLKMVMKMFDEDKAPPASSNMEKMLETMATGFGAMMQSSMQMQQAQMASMQTVMNQSMGMLQQVQTLGQQDPIITALTMAPDIIERLFGGVVNSIGQYKESRLELIAAEAAHGLSKAGNGTPKIPAPQPSPAAAPTPSNGNGKPKPANNDFLKVVYESYRRGIPPNVAAENVQYYIPEDQLHGILSVGPDQVVAYLEQSGLKKFFDQDPKLRQYVLGIVVEIQALYAEAADKAAAEAAAKKKTETVAP